MNLFYDWFVTVEGVLELEINLGSSCCNISMMDEFLSQVMGVIAISDPKVETLEEGAGSAGDMHKGFVCL